MDHAKKIATISYEPRRCFGSNSKRASRWNWIIKISSELDRCRLASPTGKRAALAAERAGVHGGNSGNIDNGDNGKRWQKREHAPQVGRQTKKAWCCHHAKVGWPYENQAQMADVR